MDAETGGWKTASPLMRWHGWGFDMAALGNKAYVLGGYQDYYDRDDWVLETMERYDEDTDTWTRAVELDFKKSKKKSNAQVVLSRFYPIFRCASIS